MYKVTERFTPISTRGVERKAHDGTLPANVVRAEAIFGGTQQMNPLFRLAAGYAADRNATDRYTTVHHAMNHDAA